MTRISVIGLGKLGACSAACFSARGYETVGIDIKEAVVASINAGKAPVEEPLLQELIDRSGTRLKASTDFREAIEGSEVTFLITPTPSLPNGHFSDRFLKSALEKLATALRDSKKHSHLFVVTSTVSPGTTESSLIPCIEKFSGRKLNEGFGVCYNPEFIALGNVIRDFLNPDLVLIGESAVQYGDQLEDVYLKVCENKPHVSRMSIVSAEIAKISLNSFVTMKISFANTLASLCEEIPGADVDAVTNALGADKRISPYYLKGGMPFGGPCFPRDNRAFAAFAKNHGLQAPLAEATDAVNKEHIKRIASRIVTLLQKTGDKSVSVLGLAYKSHTPVVEESAALVLVSEFLREGIRVTAYDPLATELARAYLGDSIQYARTMKECLEHSRFWIIASNDPEFATIDDSYVTVEPTRVFDCWRILTTKTFLKKVEIVGIGIKDNSIDHTDAGVKPNGQHLRVGC